VLDTCLSHHTSALLRTTENPVTLTLYGGLRSRASMPRWC